MTSLQGMQRSLAVMVSQVRESSNNIDVASSEIASGHLDLSQRTEHAASSLQQTASSMAARDRRHPRHQLGRVGAAQRHRSGQRAVRELDEVTQQQNAALVEQSAAAAQSLQTQVQRLAELMRGFRLEAGTAAVA